MGLFDCCYHSPILPQTFPRLVRSPGSSDPSDRGRSRDVCRHTEGHVGWCGNLFDYWVLFAARTHQSLWWVQKLLHQSPWHLKHCWNCPPVGISCLGSGSLHSVSQKNTKSEPFVIAIHVVCSVQIHKLCLSLSEICQFLTSYSSLPVIFLF